MRTMLAIAALALAVASPCKAQVLLFAGQVQQQTLVPDGAGWCEAACAPTEPVPKGMHRVCFSNSPGCQLAEVKVIKNYMGTSEGTTQSFRTRIGEWGKIDFPTMSSSILVYVVNGQTSWAPLIERGAKTYFNATTMRQLGKLDPRTLPADKDGLVLLDVLIERILTDK